MKKAKLFFTAAAIFAIVGGSLAFKAQRNFTIFTGPSVNSCPTLVQATFAPIGTGSLVYATTSSSGTTNCIATYTERNL